MSKLASFVDTPPLELPRDATLWGYLAGKRLRCLGGDFLTHSTSLTADQRLAMGRAEFTSRSSDTRTIISQRYSEEPILILQPRVVRIDHDQDPVGEYRVWIPNNADPTTVQRALYHLEPILSELASLPYPSGGFFTAEERKLLEEWPRPKEMERPPVPDSFVFWGCMDQDREDRKRRERWSGFLGILFELSLLAAMFSPLLRPNVLLVGAFFLLAGVCIFFKFRLSRSRKDVDYHVVLVPVAPDVFPFGASDFVAGYGERMIFFEGEPILWIGENTGRVRFLRERYGVWVRPDLPDQVLRAALLGGLGLPDEAKNRFGPTETPIK